MKSNFCQHNIDFYHLTDQIHVVDTEHHYEDADFGNFDLIFLNLQYYQIFDHFNLMNISDRILDFVIQILKDNHKKVMMVLPKSTDWLSISNFFVFLKNEIKELDFKSLQMIKIHIDRQLEYLLIIFDLPVSIKRNKIEEYDRRITKNSIIPEYQSYSSQAELIQTDHPKNNMNKIGFDENIDEFQEISSNVEKMSEERLITINTFSLDENNETKLLKKETFKIGSNEEILSKNNLLINKEKNEIIKFIPEEKLKPEEMITLKTENMNQNKNINLNSSKKEDNNGLETIETLTFERLDADATENATLISTKKQEKIQYIGKAKEPLEKVHQRLCEEINKESIAEMNHFENKELNILQEKPIEICLIKHNDNLNESTSIQKLDNLSIPNSLENIPITSIEVNSIQELFRKTIENLEMKVIVELENQILEKKEREENESKEQFVIRLFKNDEEEKNKEEEKKNMLEELKNDRDVFSVSESESNRCEVISFSTESPVFVE